LKELAGLVGMFAWGLHVDRTSETREHGFGKLAGERGEFRVGGGDLPAVSVNSAPAARRGRASVHLQASERRG
jgi:hypothetical protein